MTIQPGTIVLCTQTGAQRHVVMGRAFDGIRWRLVYRVDEVFYGERVAGEGDLTEVTPAPAYLPGKAVSVNGEPATVVADLGDVVVVSSPPTRYETEGGEFIAVPASEARPTKADLVLASMVYRRPIK